MLRLIDNCMIIDIRLLLLLVLLFCRLIRVRVFIVVNCREFIVLSRFRCSSS